MKMKFRTKYDYRKVHKSFKGVKSLTDQQYKDECSITGIISRYGCLPPPSVKPLSADVSEFTDFADCLNRVEDALDQFQAMPSNIRARFGHDPKAFFDFVLNPENVDEALKLGLMVKNENKPTSEELLQQIVKNTSPEKGEKV